MFARWINSPRQHISDATWLHIGRLMARYLRRPTDCIRVYDAITRLRHTMSLYATKKR